MGTVTPHYPDDHPPSAAGNAEWGSLPNTACVANAVRGATSLIPERQVHRQGARPGSNPSPGTF